MTVSRATALRVFVTTSALALSTGSAVLAQAAETDPTAIAEVIVTAERRSERIQDLPLAISAYSGDALQKAGVSGLADLGRLEPTLTLSQAGPQTYITLRGIGAQVASIGSEAAVNVSQDGVVFARHLFFNNDFMDVERVEVLRGPQGTISGRNATGGSINVITRRPTNAFEAGVGVSYGNYNRYATNGYISGPILDGALRGRLAFSTENANGWLKDLVNNQRLGSKDLVHGRLSLAANPTETLDAFLSIDLVRDQGLPMAVATSGRAAPNTPSFGEVFKVPELDVHKLTIRNNQRTDYLRQQAGASLILKQQLGEKATLTSVSSYWKTDVTDVQDTDGTTVSVGDFPFFRWHDWQLTQELTLAADLTDRLDLIAGGLYMRERARQPLEYVAAALLVLPGAYVTHPKQDLHSYSVYGQLRYRLTDQLRASAGVRFTRDKKRYDEPATVPCVFVGACAAPPFFGVPVHLPVAHESWDAVTPRFALDYSVNPEATLYAVASRGFKAGGYNTLTFGQDTFDPEFVWNYEVGAKTYFFDRRLRANVSAFYMDYTQLQVTVFRNVNGSVVSQVENVPKAIIKGVELELEARVTSDFTLSGSLARTNAEVDKAEGINPLTGVFGSFKGNTLPNSPKLHYTLSAEYAHPIADGYTGRLRADYSWRSHQFFDFWNNRLISEDSYGLLNLSAAVETDDGHWTVGAFARNLTDERYFTRRYSSSIVPGVPLNESTLGEPRMYGVSLAYKY